MSLGTTVLAVATTPFSTILLFCSFLSISQFKTRIPTASSALGHVRSMTPCLWCARESICRPADARGSLPSRPKLMLP
ncbi:hypothetical protein B0T16DRAFT_407759 [Cercophora newfieldiana]|uniref:Uncharacterized protein n=1 Tax=Cercophora newfieldiana TaxID=92897 RepID=A0AA39Y9D5_9PEZI|nr:hypothetical protein B0T16DRAFT_407759 [Cercophora newfieldiana]